MDRLGDLLNAAPVALGCRREPGLDDVHPERVQLAGQSQFRLRRHRVSGRLFAVAQRGIEDDDILSHGSPPFFSVR